MARKTKAVQGKSEGKGKPLEVDRPLTEFHLFNKLPAEIRLEIWKLNLPGPRVIELKRVWKPTRILSTRDPIANLAVCQESRYEALKVYELAFPTKKSPARTYIDFSIDIVFINGSIDFSATGSYKVLWKSFSRIRNLGVLSRGLYANFRHFSSLEKIILIQDKRGRGHTIADKKMNIYHFDEGDKRTPSWWCNSKHFVQLNWKIYHRDFRKIEAPPLKISCARVFY